jgi:uroporphyrinogen-III synthase
VGRVPLQPLEGYTVGVTADPRVAEQSELLRRHGARVIDGSDRGPAHLLIRAALEDRVHAITFMTASATRQLLAIASEHGLTDGLLGVMNTRVVAVCVGPACADAARRAGIADPLAPNRGLLETIVRALEERLHAARGTLAVGDTTVELQGHAVLVGDEHVQLTRREASVLAVLAARPGVVVSAGTLLRTVWSSASSDEHVVGVTVGRLRRKLGAVSSAIRTVPRRGYQLDATTLT